MKWRGAGDPDPDVTERGRLQYTVSPMQNPLDRLEARLVALYDSREGRDVVHHQPGLILALHELRELREDYRQTREDTEAAQGAKMAEPVLGSLNPLRDVEVKVRLAMERTTEPARLHALDDVLDMIEAVRQEQRKIAAENRPGAVY